MHQLAVECRYSPGVPSNSMRPRPAAVALLALALAILAPGLARADDLAALIWLVVVWPAGVVFTIALIILGVIAVVRMCRGRNGQGRFGLAVVVVATVLDVVFSILCLWAGADTDMSIALLHIGVFQVAAVPCLLIGRASWRRGRSGSPPA